MLSHERGQRLALDRMTELQRILYVEDEPDIQMVALIALEQVGGFTVEACSSGPEALEKAPGFSPDLFLLDVMMPIMDGPETFQELRKIPNFSNIPAIFVTARVQADDIDRLMNLGAAGVIPKPFDPMTLSEQIKEIFEGST